MSQKTLLLVICTDRENCQTIMPLHIFQKCLSMPNKHISINDTGSAEDNHFVRFLSQNVKSNQNLITGIFECAPDVMGDAVVLGAC